MEGVNTKWIATVASIWIQISVGASYTFGIYSSILKSSQGYDQSTLDTVSVFKDIGANAGILSGLLYSAVTLRNNRRRLGVFGGPWVVLLAGAIQCFVGYFVMWASVVGLIRRLPVPVMCFFMWMAAHAQTFFNTTNVVSGVHNFGDYGGTIVGIMKKNGLRSRADGDKCVVRAKGRSKLGYVRAVDVQELPVEKALPN
ncbi:unnamed protein product [Dovyalis caffra]|uniref:Nodulin-like domain-containing protein n=1 Tax=Dovyalis caffra TaxID=77055 RepID=A0AAV1QMI7_9ROSI|nr:unnamed protein product [Dovyalis caffra]